MYSCIQVLFRSLILIKRLQNFVMNSGSFRKVNFTLLKVIRIIVNVLLNKNMYFARISYFSIDLIMKQSSLYCAIYSVYLNSVLIQVKLSCIYFHTPYMEKNNSFHGCTPIPNYILCFYFCHSTWYINISLYFKNFLSFIKAS